MNSRVDPDTVAVQIFAEGLRRFGSVFSLCPFQNG